jgi:hypothetical protein
VTREEFKLRYRIASGRRGQFYDRGRLRSFLRGRWLVPVHLAEALAFIDDDAWMRRHKGQTPSSIFHDIEVELYGQSSWRARGRRS